LSPLGKGSALVTGSYDIPMASLRSRAVFTNTMPTNAYRSSFSTLFDEPKVGNIIRRLQHLASSFGCAGRLLPSGVPSIGSGRSI
jgi:carbon-monoxide dehydrogenase large subunit